MFFCFPKKRTIDVSIPHKLAIAIIFAIGIRVEATPMSSIENNFAFMIQNRKPNPAIAAVEKIKKSEFA